MLSVLPDGPMEKVPRKVEKVPKKVPTKIQKLKKYQEKVPTLIHQKNDKNVSSVGQAWGKIFEDF